MRWPKCQVLPACGPFFVILIDDNILRSMLRLLHAIAGWVVVAACRTSPWCRGPVNDNPPVLLPGVAPNGAPSLTAGGPGADVNA